MSVVVVLRVVISDCPACHNQPCGAPVMATANQLKLVTAKLTYARSCLQQIN